MSAMIELVMIAALAAGGSVERDAVCTAWAQSARTVMAARQSGESADDMMKRFGPDMDDTIRRTIVAAYSRPRSAGAAQREREIADFGDRAFVECMSAR